MVPTLEPGDRARLRQFLEERFSMEELKTLAFDLDVHYEALPHGTTTEFSIALITYFEHRGNLNRLSDEVKIKRPDYPKPETGDSPPKPSRLRVDIDPFGYTVPVLPENFIGHRWAVDHCRTHLTALQPASIAVSGQRKIGKTSLLHLMRKCGQDPDWGQHFCLFLNCASLSSNFNPLTFWREVLSRVQTEPSLGPTSPVLAQIADLQKRPDLPHYEMARFFTDFCQSYPA